MPYQNAMTFFIHHMNQQRLMGEDIVSHTSLKPADLQSPLSARYVQEAYTQAHAAFTSYLGHQEYASSGISRQCCRHVQKQPLCYDTIRERVSRTEK